MMLFWWCLGTAIVSVVASTVVNRWMIAVTIKALGDAVREAREEAEAQAKTEWRS